MSERSRNLVKSQICTLKGIAPNLLESWISPFSFIGRYLIRIKVFYLVLWGAEILDLIRTQISNVNVGFDHLLSWSGQFCGLIISQSGDREDLPPQSLMVGFWTPLCLYPCDLATTISALSPTGTLLFVDFIPTFLKINIL